MIIILRTDDNFRDRDGNFRDDDNFRDPDVCFRDPDDSCSSVLILSVKKHLLVLVSRRLSSTPMI